ncbi:PTS N-acetylglucosamine transporter subunit IIBC [Companilactobacillus allii]|uniref:PTS N-acetylglucosamine transporter subunit IIBC n=1 Tax=Companilactobacillus allii TaxID=1847728 RepID=A0A1P8Q0D4_9LACO|nr:PTS N-acetylglucosamine transporter subunit IIBC [Companilactobacillus allii]APX71333.1 PTS N-acetylglucosamine transporter subunit IIBC [Companilactobacillus allii]USQ68414.1 PTS N-acetylglucosamine transporter subunit IIBC [Companilactobacillus allii]
MKRKLILASHHKLADGLADTLDFITGGVAKVETLSAYMDNDPIENKIKDLMDEPEDTEIVVLTDMTAGSVNQKFFSYRTRAHTHIISGMNLPLALSLAMEPTDQYLTTSKVEELISQAKEAIVYVNTMQVEVDDDDE